jgi:hypothetical protein
MTIALKDRDLILNQSDRSLNQQHLEKILINYLNYYTIRAKNNTFFSWFLTKISIICWFIGKIAIFYYLYTKNFCNR